MCGITGEAGFIAPGEDIVRAMAKTLEHRGPDDEGYFSAAANEWSVNLGMRRLAIIDREGGKQPMHAGKVSLVFNGEVYGHRRIRDNMAAAGTRFRTRSDTEVIGRLWDKEGPSCLSQLDGMFGIGLWDRVEKALYLVRDRMGKKPLYFYHGQNLLAFGSELKALLAHPSVPREMNPEGIYHYLSLQYVPEPTTAYKGIFCVPPGSYVKYSPKTDILEEVQWWSLEPDDGVRPGGECPVDYVSRTREAVEEAITCRLESEVPLGVYLSGGIDSAIVTGVAKESCPELHTFCMGFEEEAYSELHEARATAKYFGTIHHEAVAKFPQLPEMTDRIVAAYDQPYGDCSAIPTMLLAEASKPFFTVALTGDGGDEAFGGYQRYWMAKPEIGEYLNWLAVLPFHVRDRILAKPFQDQVRGALHTKGWLLQKAAQFPGQGVRNQMGWVDIHSYLPNDIIVKMERATMAASVEARCPFLDHRVMGLACAIPEEHKFQPGVGKMVLKEAFKDILPLSIILRPKRGFGVPMNEWLRSDVGRQMLMEMMTDLSWPWEIFEPSGVTQLVETHLKGDANIGHALWIILILHLWLKKHFG